MAEPLQKIVPKHLGIQVLHVEVNRSIIERAEMVDNHPGKCKEGGEQDEVFGACAHCASPWVPAPTGTSPDWSRSESGPTSSTH